MSRPDQSRRATALAGDSSEEARAFLQQRIQLVTALFAIVSSGFLVASVVLICAFYPRSAWSSVLWQRSIFFHAASTVLPAGVWWYTRRDRLQPRTLLVLDAGTTTGASLLLALMGASIHDAIGWTQGLLATCFLLSARAIAVPSSGTRTLAISATASLAAILAVAWFGGDSSPIPPSIRIINLALWLTAATGIATFASRIIFGLQQEVRSAQKIGQYVLKRKLGEGGMGVVYLATHALLRRETAVKLLLPGRVAPPTLARFEREVQQLARLTHPNTVAIYDYGRTPDGIFYFAMEYLDGLDLDQLVSAVGPLPPRRVVYLLEQVCGSLAEAHEMGLVHRDIKPANVLVCQHAGVADRVKVLDFGLVKDLHNPNEVALTATRSFLGTPLYAAPEAIRAPDEVTAASDLYAVAALGYYLLTGSHVFEGQTVVEVCAGHLHGNPQPPSERLRQTLPADLEHLVMRGLSKTPAERPSSARAFAQALRDCSGVGTWGGEEARAWWSSVGQGLLLARARQSAPPPAESTLAVDLGGRCC